MQTFAVPLFKKQLSKLTGEVKQRAIVAVSTISESSDPASLGVRKGISYVVQDCPECVVFAYEINQSYRILYCVGKDCLTFVGVGDHKAVYKKG